MILTCECGETKEPLLAYKDYFGKGPHGIRTEDEKVVFRCTWLGSKPCPNGCQKEEDD